MGDPCSGIRRADGPATISPFIKATAPSLAHLQAPLRTPDHPGVSRGHLVPALVPSKAPRRKRWGNHKGCPYGFFADSTIVLAVRC